MANTMMKGTANNVMKKKTLSISAKRQITIPQKFYTILGFESKAECMVRNGELIIRPVKQETGGEFAEQILADLISEGYSGDELLNEFKARQAKVRPTIEKLISDAEKAALGEGEFATFEEVFGSEDEK